MTRTLREVNAVVERLWPLSGASDWDAPGLVVGDPDQPVARVLLAVDAVGATVDELLQEPGGLLLVHHPLLMRGVTTVAGDRYKGALIARLIRGDAALIAAHTNADVVVDGTSDVLARRLGLLDAVPIVPASDGVTGLGRVGDLAEPTTLGRIARLLAEVLPATATGVRVAGDVDQPVRRIAVCGGAGDSLLSHGAVRGADLYVTADLRHHPASEAREQAILVGGPALIDVSHWASESLWLEAAAAALRRELPELDIRVSGLRTDPWDFVVTQEPTRPVG